MGLQNGGVPIKFSSYHTFQFPVSSTINALIQERSRSVKSLFSVVRRSPALLHADSGATVMTTQAGTTLKNYQYRIGGRYFPASPVQVSTNFGSEVSNSGCEAFCELQKALNTVGDYRLSSGVNTLRWGFPTSQSATLADPSGSEEDYSRDYLKFAADGSMTVSSKKTPQFGNLGAQCFAMAVSLESSNGMEISGLNANEQSDISLQANWSSTSFGNGVNLPYLLEVYSFYDAMLVLHENNVIELIE